MTHMTHGIPMNMFLVSQGYSNGAMYSPKVLMLGNNANQREILATSGGDTQEEGHNHEAGDYSTNIKERIDSD